MHFHYNEDEGPNGKRSTSSRGAAPHPIIMIIISSSSSSSSIIIIIINMLTTIVIIIIVITGKGFISVLCCLICIDYILGRHLVAGGRRVET